MEQVVIVQIKQIYGTERIYPVNAQAKLFAEIACQVTLRRSDLEKIKLLGYRIEVAQVSL